MAKRKKPKVKDLRPEKLNEEQIKQVQQVISLSNKIKLELGNCLLYTSDAADEP